MDLALPCVGIFVTLLILKGLAAGGPAGRAHRNEIRTAVLRFFKENRRWPSGTGEIYSLAKELVPERDLDELHVWRTSSSENGVQYSICLEDQLETFTVWQGQLK